MLDLISVLKTLSRLAPCASWLLVWPHARGPF